MRAIILCVVIGLAATIAQAEDITAGSDAVLRAGRSSATKVVASVKKGEKIPVLERVTERNVKWVRSASGGREGWTTENSLKKAGGTDLSKVASAATGDAQANAATDAAAAKGVEPLTLAYSGANGLDTSGLDRLMALRARIIDSGEFEQFSKQGNVGMYRR
ncbi:MAG TPA: hypothetical protein PLD59_07645 [Tepidisphaeraceae bacterium]|nr:hypothetical protein [Tepidisphaeraceae bacterium]